MAKITALPDTHVLTGDEFLPIVQGADTRRTTMSAFRNLITPYLQYWYKGEVGDTGPADNTYPTYAALLASDPTRRAARLVPEDDETEPAGTFYFIAGQWTRQSGKGISTRARGPAAVDRDVDDALNDWTSAAAYGAKLDGVHDDTDAVQRAIDYCLSFPRAKALRITGRARITRALRINRLVDTTESEFRIIAEGEGAGFYTDQPIFLFDTTLSVTGWLPQPLSEFVTFEGVQFEASEAALEAMVMSHLFLRIKFLNCYFSKIKVVDSPLFLQSWYFDHCNFRDWFGRTFRSFGPMFDCNFIGNIWEHGQDGIESTSSGAYGLRIIGNLFEGSRQFFKQAGGYGLVIHGNYTEHNIQPDYIFTSRQLGGAARGTSFVGNQMTVTHNDFNVKLGDIRSFASSGNYCSANLFDMGGTSFGRLQSMGDYAEGVKFSRYASAGEVAVSGAQTSESGIIATPGGGLLEARPLLFGVNIVDEVTTDFDSVGLPPTDDVADQGISRRVVVINSGQHILRVHSAANDFTNYGTNLFWDLAPGAARTFFQYGLGKMAAA